MKSKGNTIFWAIIACLLWSTAYALLSWLLIKDEYPEWLTIAGMIVITISLIMYYRKPGKIIPVQEI